MKPTRTRYRFGILHAVAAALALAFVTSTAHADPAPTGAPPAAPTATPPATAPAPAPAPATPPAPPAAPGATVPAPGARREEETGQEAPQPPATQPSATAGLFDRALAYMQTKDGLAAKISNLEAENKRLAAELDKANATIAAQNAELGELRAGKEKIEAALGKLEAEQTTVSGQVAALGFKAQNLPPSTPIEAAADSLEGLSAAFKAEKDPAKRGELAAQIAKARDAAAKAKAAQN